MQYQEEITRALPPAEIIENMDINPKNEIIKVQGNIKRILEIRPTNELENRVS